MTERPTEGLGWNSPYHQQLLTDAINEARKVLCSSASKLPEDIREDIAAEAVVKVLRDCTVVDDRAKFLARVRIAARTGAIDEWRRAKSLKRGGGKEFVELEESDVPSDEVVSSAAFSSPVDILHSREWSDAIYRVASRMSSPYREVLQLIFLEGRNSREVSEQLGIPIRNIGTYKERSLRKFLKLASEDLQITELLEGIK